ncbi:hypothetical protein A9X06_29025 [Mycobacterium sp. 852002-51759_SCH5129042]|nr:hypothetical protein A9X06_29025 [Mycobacterium sp. 852002-51759_SCH5129042]
MNPALFAAAARLCHRFLGPHDYALAYGSHAVGRAGPRSDLDLVLITATRPDHEEVAALIAAVRALHAEFGLDLDTEVDYATKLVADRADVDLAAGLGCFDRAGERIVPEPVRIEPGWLNSRSFAVRLLLNALTSEHVFLGGDTARYRRDRARAEKALAQLVLAMRSPATETTLDQAVRVLTRTPGGAIGKDFLGYTPTAHLCSTLYTGMTALSDDGRVRIEDGHRFHRLPPNRPAAGPAADKH